MESRVRYDIINDSISIRPVLLSRLSYDIPTPNLSRSVDALTVKGRVWRVLKQSPVKSFPT